MHEIVKLTLNIHRVYYTQWLHKQPGILEKTPKKSYLDI